MGPRNVPVFSKPLWISCKPKCCWTVILQHALQITEVHIICQENTTLRDVSSDWLATQLDCHHHHQSCLIRQEKWPVVSVDKTHYKSEYSYESYIIDTPILYHTGTVGSMASAASNVAPWQARGLFWVRGYFPPYIVLWGYLDLHLLISRHKSEQPHVILAGPRKRLQYGKGSHPLPGLIGPHSIHPCPEMPLPSNHPPVAPPLPRVTLPSLSSKRLGFSISRAA